MNVIKSSIYYNSSTGKISLPNMTPHSCKICDNADYYCATCKDCALHQKCRVGVQKLTNQRGVPPYHWPTNFCLKCDKNYYDFRRIEIPWCNICYLCHDCHSKIPCEYKKQYCEECKFDTIHCVGCDICLKHQCHGNGMEGFDDCGAYFGINLMQEDRERYKYPVQYEDRCSKCLTFIDGRKSTVDKENDDLGWSYWIDDTLWVCKACTNVECGRCFHTSRHICSLCIKMGLYCWDFEWDRILTERMDGFNNVGAICAICYKIGGRYNKSLHSPNICEECSDTGTPFDVKRIPIIRNKIPHIAALVPLNIFPEIIKYCIFEYYYEERHYLIGELDDVIEN
jgi:hypothetical protein